MNILLRKIRSAIWRLFGIDKINQELRDEKAKTARLREEVDTLQYFLNKLHDCSSLPPTDDPDLRIMQECDVVLLKIFDKICKKHNITYWLDWGTLLGAVRHNGFIPWDDDMDVCVPRNDYEKLLEILTDEFKNTSFEVSKEIFNPVNEFCCTRIGIGYKHQQTGIWLDVFPMEFVVADTADKGTWIKAMDFYRTTGNWDEECVFGKGTNRYAYCPGDSYNTIPWPIEMLFPLTTLNFENFNAPVPGNYVAYVEQIYRNHRNFPKTGVEHHDMGRGPLKSWAKKNNIDMCQIKSELSAVLTLYEVDNIEK